MDYTREIHPHDFDCFLAWLHPNREAAGDKYETLRRGLLHFFQRRGCPLADAEALTDETIHRVISKAPTLAPTYEGEPARYFYGVAQRVWQEYLRRPQLALALPMSDESALSKERRQHCREHCLNQLASADRNLMLAYYQVEPHSKATRRHTLAAELGLTCNGLTVRVFRLRQKLHDCLERCFAESSAHDIFPL